MGVYSVGGGLASTMTDVGIDLASQIFGLDASRIIDRTGTYKLWFSSNGELVLTGVTYAVPEPSTYGLLGGAMLLGLIAWRRRRNRKQGLATGSTPRTTEAVMAKEYENIHK